MWQRWCRVGGGRSHQATRIRAFCRFTARPSRCSNADCPGGIERGLGNQLVASQVGTGRVMRAAVDGDTGRTSVVGAATRVSKERGRIAGRPCRASWACPKPRGRGVGRCLQLVVGRLLQGDQRVVSSRRRAKDLIELALGGLLRAGLRWMTKTMARVVAAASVWNTVSSLAGNPNTAL